MIEFSNVSFTYQGMNKECIKNISLVIHPGEVVVLAGASGCGKTTMTRLVNGLIPNFYDGKLTGDIKIDNQNITSLDMKNISGIVGSVFQDPRSQFFTMEVKSELVFACENHAVERDHIINRVDNTIEKLDLETLFNKTLSELSSGEKQKAAIGSVHTMQPDIYVLDEPSANLDYESTQKLYLLLKQIKAEGSIIIISEHKLYYLTALLDRLVYMKNGNAVLPERKC